MHPRLELLRNLLAEDGSIWISIDDDERDYLKVLCDEVFGRFNFVCGVIWEKKYSPQNDTKWLSDSHEYVLVYAKNKDIWRPNLLPRSEEMDSRYKNPDNDPRGEWQSGDLVASGERSTGHFIVRSPKTGKEFDVPQGKHWVYSQDNLTQMIADNQIWFGADGNSFPRKKRFLAEAQDGRKSNTLWLSSEVGHNQSATREVIELFDGERPFSFPKPVELIKRCLQLTTSGDDLVVDFFAGSSTTAHAVMQLNAEDNSNRRFILVQLPEVTDEKSEAAKAGYANICEIGKERIRRAGAKIKADNPLGTESLDAERRVYGVGADVKYIVCLAPRITPEDAELMAESAPGRIIFAEQCFSNTEEKSNVRLILKDRGITIRTL